MTEQIIQGLAVFYGTIPLIVILLGIWFREQMLLKDILSRLARLETKLDDVGKDISKIKERLVALELRAGIIYHE